MINMTIYMTNILLDLAPGPEALLGMLFDIPGVLVLAVLVLVALAIVLIVKASRKNRAKKNQNPDNQP